MIQGGERLQLLGSAMRTGSGQLVLMQMAQSLERAISDPQPGSLPHAPASLPKHAAVVLISDFLMPIEDIEAAVSSFAGRSARGHLLQVLDPAEESLPYTGRIRFQGYEDEGQLLIERTEDVRESYRHRLAEHRERLAALTNRMGWTFGVHHTDKPPHTALVTLHNRLAEQPW